MRKSFIRVTPDRGQNNRALSVKADLNENGVSRSTTFKVEGGGITKSVSVEQDPSPYIYMDCGYIFSNANIQEPYELSEDNIFKILSFNVQFANFILSSRSQFVIKNISSLQVELNNPVIDNINIASFGSHSSNISLNEFTAEVVPNSENEGKVLSIIDITSAKLNEIVTKLNAVREDSTTGVAEIRIFIEKNSTQNRLYIVINVI